MNLLIVLPILVPLITALILLFLWGRVGAQRVVSVVGSGALLAITVFLLFTVREQGVLAGQMANWPAPFGITLVADLTSAIMLLMNGLVGFTIALYSLGSIERQREVYGYHFLVHMLLMGVSGAFLTGDLFNLFVWFEVMLISSFVLIALGGTSEQIQGALKYVTLSLLASMLFLVGVGVVYGTTGTLNMADLAVYFASNGVPSGLMTTLAMLFLVSFGIKSAVFPLFFWLPASYHTGPVAVSALFAGLLTKVGVYALVRVNTLVFGSNSANITTVLLVIAGFTMVVGVIGAVAQSDLRRLLSFHIISQIGYMIMGLALFTPLALAGVLFFVVHNILAKTNLFLISGVLARLRGTEELDKLGGFYRSRPGISMLFLISAISLAGLPPTSGFWGKLMLVRAGLEIEQYVIVGVSLFVSVLTLFSMTKIWAEAFWKEAPGPDHVTDRPVPRSTWAYLLAPVLIYAVLTLGMGFTVEPVIVLMEQAAQQLLDPSEYVRAVLGTDAVALLGR